jgi:hypothetical protein
MTAVMDYSGEMGMVCSRTELDQMARTFSMLQPHPETPAIVIFAFDFGVFWAERSKQP